MIIINEPLQLEASVGSVKQALTTSRSDVIVEHVEPSHLSARTKGRVDGPPYVAKIKKTHFLFHNIIYKKHQKIVEY